jgi:hypothetical protein
MTAPWLLLWLGSCPDFELSTRGLPAVQGKPAKAKAPGPTQRIRHFDCVLILPQKDFAFLAWLDEMRIVVDLATKSSTDRDTK